MIRCVAVWQERMRTGFARMQTSPETAAASITRSPRASPWRKRNAAWRWISAAAWCGCGELVAKVCGESFQPVFQITRMPLARAIGGFCCEQPGSEFGIREAFRRRAKKSDAVIRCVPDCFSQWLKQIAALTSHDAEPGREFDALTTQILKLDGFLPRECFCLALRLKKSSRSPPVPLKIHDELQLRSVGVPVWLEAERNPHPATVAISPAQTSNNGEECV